MKRFSVTMSLGAAGLATLLLLPVQGCTDLSENPPSLITSSNFFHNEAEVLAGLAGVYAQLRSTAPEGGIYDANEVSTDEIVVPIRGKDWNDNGQWIDLHNQTWTPTSAATLNFLTVPGIPRIPASRAPICSSRQLRTRASRSRTRRRLSPK